MKILTRDWDKSSMDLWKRLRKVVMKYPTADQNAYNEEMIIREMYINSDTNLNKYLYTQRLDFDNVVVDFNNDIDTKDYVLGKLSKEEISKLDELLPITVNLLDDFLELNFDIVMNRYNQVR